jgi:hypothetical protein
MRKLEEFRGRHADQDIYVLASGKSIDYYDISILDGCTVIGVNQMSRIAQCTYTVRKEISDELFRLHLDQQPSGTLFISAGLYGLNDTRNTDQVSRLLEQDGSQGASRVCCFPHARNIGYGSLACLPEDCLVTTTSTITTAIHLAAFMGAKRVFLMGHDCCSIGGETNCTGYHDVKTRAFFGRDPSTQVQLYMDWLPRLRAQTEAVSRLVQAKYGTHVVSLSPFIGLGLPDD